MNNFSYYLPSVALVTEFTEMHKSVLSILGVYPAVFLF